MAYSFEITLSDNANFRIYNVNKCVFSTDGVWNYAFSSKFWKMFMYFYILPSGIILRYIWFHKMFQVINVMLGDFFRETA